MMETMEPLQKFILEQRLREIVPLMDQNTKMQLLQQLMGEGGRAGEAPGRGPQTSGEWSATQLGAMDPSQMSALGYDARRGLAAGAMFGKAVAAPSSILGTFASGIMGRPSPFDSINESQLGGILGVGTSPIGLRSARESLDALATMDPQTRESTLSALGGLEGLKGMMNRSAYEGEERNAQSRTVGQREGFLGQLDALSTMLGGWFGGGGPGPSPGMSPGIGGYNYGDQPYGGMPGMGPDNDPGADPGADPGGIGHDAGDTGQAGYARGGAHVFNGPSRPLVGEGGRELGIFVKPEMAQPGMQGNEQEVRRALMMAMMMLNGGFNGRSR